MTRPLSDAVYQCTQGTIFGKWAISMNIITSPLQRPGSTGQESFLSMGAIRPPGSRVALPTNDPENIGWPSAAAHMILALPSMNNHNVRMCGETL